MSLDQPDSEGRLRKGSYSFYEKDMLQLEALAAQRGRKKDTDLQKEAMHSGVLIESIREEPDPVSGKYGNLKAEDIVKMIRPLIVQAADWLAQQGHPIHPPAADLSALLGALVGKANVPQPGVAPSPNAAYQAGQPTEGAFIRGSVLDNLGLDDDPVY